MHKMGKRYEFLLPISLIPIFQICMESARLGERTPGPEQQGRVFLPRSSPSSVCVLTRALNTWESECRTLHVHFGFSILLFHSAGFFPQHINYLPTYSSHTKFFRKYLLNRIYFFESLVVPIFKIYWCSG